MRKGITMFSMLLFPTMGLAGDPVAKPENPYDLVVYGATASGVATAISAAREGAKVALLEPTTHVGGMVTGGLGATDYGNKACIGGFALEFYKRLGKHYGGDINWRPEPHVAEDTFTAMLKEAGVPVFFQHRLKEGSGVKKEGTTVTGILMENGAEFKAKVFADCSYEGDLMAQSGIKFSWGREGEGEYGEDLAGVREWTPKHQFNVKIKARDEQGNLYWGIQEGPRGADGAADRKVQAYNFRICMTQNKANMVPFPKPPHYDPAKFKLLALLIDETKKQTGAAPKVNELMDPGPIEGAKTDTNNNGAFSTDYIGGNWDYPNASYAERQKIWDDHYEYVAGFLYFLANDPSVAPEVREEMQTWGLAADEFKDTGNWPRQLYVREGRRMIGEYVMSQRDIQTTRSKDDVIGMGSYNSDSHNVQRFENAEGFVENEGDMQVAVKPYQIPYRMITPKAAEAANVLVPVCFSASHVAYSTLRMEPQYMIIGEAAGVAAALAAKGGQAVQQVSADKLTQTLQSRGGVMKLEDDSVAGFEDPRKVYGH